MENKESEVIMITKIISGGQTGAGQAALDAACPNHVTSTGCSRERVGHIEMDIGSMVQFSIRRNWAISP